MHTVLRYDDKPHLLTSCLFATGRSCILHLLRKYEPDAVFVPDFHPAGVGDPIDRHAVKRVHYKTRDNLEVDVGDLSFKMRAIGTKRPLVIVIHFFGYRLPTWGAAGLAHMYGGIVLEDCAHCLPNDEGEAHCGDVRLYVYNKLFPLIDGARMMSCTPRVDISAPGDLEPLQGEAVEAYSRHLSANRVIAAMPAGKCDTYDGVMAVSSKAYDDYYAIVSQDMEPRKPASMEYFGGYDHDKERDVRLWNAERIYARVAAEHRFRDGLPTFAFPVRLRSSQTSEGLFAALFSVGMQPFQIGPLWSGSLGPHLLLPLRKPLDAKQLDKIGELFG